MKQKNKSAFVFVGLLIACIILLFYLGQPADFSSEDHIVAPKPIPQATPNIETPEAEEGIPKDELLRILREKLENFREGQISFSTPKQMYVGELELIEVNITDDLKKQLKTEEEGEIFETAKIDIYTYMKPELKGTNFKIEPHNEKSLIIPEDKVVTWRWNVTPTKNGEHKLFLTIYANLKLDDSRERYPLKTFERTINVNVNPANWFLENWFNLATTFVSVFGAGLFAFIVSKLSVVKDLRKKINSKIKNIKFKIK